MSALFRNDAMSARVRCVTLRQPYCALSSLDKVLCDRTAITASFAYLDHFYSNRHSHLHSSSFQLY